MAESKMPERIWDDEGFAAVASLRTENDIAYYRADLVDDMVKALDDAIRLFTDIRGDFQDPREVCDEGREIANAVLSRYRAAVGGK